MSFQKGIRTDRGGFGTELPRFAYVIRNTRAWHLSSVRFFFFFFYVHTQLIYRQGMIEGMIESSVFFVVFSLVKSFLDPLQDFRFIHLLNRLTSRQDFPLMTH